MAINRQSLQVRNGNQVETAQVWVGGEGLPLVLLHGGWGGAEAHWERVWNQLAQRFKVIAPELPGIVPDGGTGDPRTTYDDYAAWVVSVVRALGYESAAYVGNSLGASIAWRVATGAPQRCQALVLVDGFPPPVIPAFMRFVLNRVPMARRKALSELRKLSYSTQAMASAFSHAANVPAQVRQTLRNPDPRVIENMLSLLLNSRTDGAIPQQPTLVVWGEQDRLPKADVSVASELHRRVSQSELCVISDAGHLPQAEQPQAFVDCVHHFLQKV